MPEERCACLITPSFGFGSFPFPSLSHFSVLSPLPFRSFFVPSFLFIPFFVPSFTSFPLLFTSFPFVSFLVGHHVSQVANVRLLCRVLSKVQSRSCLPSGGTGCYRTKGKTVQTKQICNFYLGSDVIFFISLGFCSSSLFPLFSYLFSLTSLPAPFCFDFVHSCAFFRILHKP